MFIHPRQPLSALDKEAPLCCFLEGDGRFDMGRLLDTEDPEYAIKFAFLEHIGRITTPTKESQEAAALLPPSLSEKMSTLIESKDSLFQEIFTVLEETISKEDLTAMQLPEVALHLEFIGEKGIVERDVIAASRTRLPKLYIGILDTQCLVLYTHHMTFLDGFSPISGQQINPVIPEQMLEALEREMYWNESGREIATQTKRPEHKVPSAEVVDFPIEPESILPQDQALPPHNRSASMKSLVVEWRSYDHRAYRKREAREACAGLICCIQ